MSGQNFLDLALSIQNVKKIEMALPICKKMASVTPLLVGDDLSLKSTVSSPQTYDRELCKLLDKHLVEWSDGTVVSKPASLDIFVSSVSNIDKICLLYAIYKSTYETLGVRKFKCSSENCKHSFVLDINLDDIIHDDTLTIWDETLPFTEYIHEFTIPYNNFNYIFGVHIPTIKDHNIILGFLNSEDITIRIENLGNLFSISEQMALLTKYIKIGKIDQPIETYATTNNIQEILITYSTAISKKIQETFFELYNQKFGKYDPKFYMNIACPTCGKIHKRMVNIELEFFRRSVFGQGELPEEKL